MTLPFSSIQLPEFQCPVCKAVMDATTTFAPETPKPQAGDLSICVYCHAIGVFQDDGSLRTATTEECQGVPDWMRGVLIPPGKPS